MSEGVLVAEAKAGDHDAFVELCNRYAFRVKQRILGIVRNQEDGDDVFQETLMRAYTHLNGFRGSCSFQTWITQIAINTALMLLRRRRIRLESSFEIVGEEGSIVDHRQFPDPSPNPEQVYVDSQTKKMLMEAIRNLPANFRPIIEGFHLRELKVTEAAQALALNEAAAKSRLSRGRAMLRRRLQNHLCRHA